MNYRADYLGLESSFDVAFAESYVRARWNIRKLGEPFPGGDWLVKDPVLEFHSTGRQPIRIQLVTVGHPDRTVCGLRCFRRMREVAMPAIPWSYAVSLPQGNYTVRFTGELYDCRRLVFYCDAMQIFAGHFSQMVEAFEEHRKMWGQRGHGEAAEPYRWPVDLSLGKLSVPGGCDQAPRYYPLDEVALLNVPWESPPKRKCEPRAPASPLAPENYFALQIADGVRAMRENGFCRWGTHCNENPAVPGNYSMGASDRRHGFWGNTFTMQYIQTGDEEIGAAAWFCARQCLELAKKEAAPHHKHCLSFGLSTMMMLRFARLVDRPELLEPVANIWRRWPYDWKKHNPATQPNAEGGDHTPNDTYNMKMIGAAAMWLLGKYIQDKDLMEKGRDCVMNFVLPAIRPEGYWYYRPGSPEGKINDGIQSDNHYDGLVKAILARLCFHPEWRQEPGMLATLRRGVDFTLKQLTDEDGRALKFELHRGANFGARETLARYLGHAGMFCEPLSLLALYEDHGYLAPLQKAVQYAYDQRDNPQLLDYWDNSWLYSLYEGLLNLSRLGLEFAGTPERLRLRAPKSGKLFLCAR